MHIIKPLHKNKYIIYKKGVTLNCTKNIFWKDKVITGVYFPILKDPKAFELSLDDRLGKQGGDYNKHKIICIVLTKE